MNAKRITKRRHFNLQINALPAALIFVAALVGLTVIGVVSYYSRLEIDAGRYREMMQAARKYPTVKSTVDEIMKSDGQVTNSKYKKIFLPALEKAQQEKTVQRKP